MDVTRKRFMKLNRAFAARVGSSEISRLSKGAKILPTFRLSYEELWAPLRFSAAEIGIGVKRTGVGHGR